MINLSVTVLQVRLWDSLTAKGVRRRFEGRVPALTARRARQLPHEVNEDA